MIYTATKSVCSKVDEYARLKIQIEELTSRAESFADDLKALMTEKGIDQLTAGTHTVAYKTVTGKRLDTVALKKFFGEDALEPMMKETSTKRFSVKLPLLRERGVMIMIHEQNREQSKVEQTPDMTVKYGKTTYLLHFRFNNRPKQTMNDKVLKLIQANWQNNPNTVQ